MNTLKNFFNKSLEIYKYRELLKNLVISELKLRYRRSALGFLWTMLNPLMTMLVLSAVFSKIMRFGMQDYTIFLISSLFPWIFFSQAVNLSLMSIVGKGSLLKKVYIPKAIIPLAAVFSCLINFLLALIPLFILLLISKRPISISLLCLPIPIIILLLFTIGVSLFFACLNVFFRDFSHMTDVLLQIWFYLSPVIYQITNIPEKYRFIFSLNPMVHILTSFRDIIFDGLFPNTHTLLIASGAALVSFSIGSLIFLHFEKHFVFNI